MANILFGRFRLTLVPTQAPGSTHGPFGPVQCFQSRWRLHTSRHGLRRNGRNREKSGEMGGLNEDGKNVRSKFPLETEFHEWPMVCLRDVANEDFADAATI